MPRESPFAIVLSKEERAQARQYTSPYCDVVRAKIVLFAAEGLSNNIIAARLDTPRQIVSKWRKRFVLARLPGLESQPRGGRPALFSPQRRRSSYGARMCTPASLATTALATFSFRDSARSDHTGIGSGD